jgi:hypothetical protein
MAAYLRKHGILTKISERVRFARRRFGRYEVIDFLAVLFGYAISGERTLEAFYERLQPFAVPFMARAGARPTKSPLDAFALFGGAHRGTHRSPAYALSRGSRESPTLDRLQQRNREANRGTAGSSGECLGGL